MTLREARRDYLEEIEIHSPPFGNELGPGFSLPRHHLTANANSEGCDEFHGVVSTPGVLQRSKVPAEVVEWRLICRR
jgi:hypothetical protein